MRTVITSFTIIICAILAICTIMTLDSSSMRQVELQTALDNAISQSVDMIGDDEFDSNKDVESYIMQSVILSVDSEASLEFKFMAVDIGKGLIDVKLTDYYKWCGVKKTIELRRTSIIEDYNEKAETQEYTAKFIVNGEIYKLVKGEAGSKLEEPPEPQNVGFQGWQEYTNGQYGEKITDIQWSDISITKDVTYVAKTDSTNTISVGSLYKDNNLSRTINYSEGENVSYTELVRDIKNSYRYPSTISSVVITGISYETSTFGGLGKPFLLDELKTNGLYTYMGKLARGETVKECVEYKLTKTSGNTIDAACDVEISFNHYPSINAPDRWLSVDSIAQTGINRKDLIFDDNNKSAISAYDNEDGNITNLIEIVNYDTIDFTKEGTYDVTYAVTDKGNKCISRVGKIHLYELDDEELASHSESYSRFISKDTFPLCNTNMYVDDDGNFRAKIVNGKLCFVDESGEVLNNPNNLPYAVSSGPDVKIMQLSNGTYKIIPLSRWYKRSSYSSLLKSMLAVDHSDYPNTHTWYFEDKQIQGIKQNIVSANPGGSVTGFDSQFYDKYKDLNMQ